MGHLFASRALLSRKSFIREILKVTQSPSIISFAGGLPNPKFFPVDEIKNAAVKVMETDGANTLQYTITEGLPSLREWISRRYARRGVDIKPDEILITNGAQQAVAIIGKTFLEKNDHVVMEKPGYLGAIQAFEFYETIFNQIDIGEDGIDTAELRKVLDAQDIQLAYLIPNFQNPTGNVYSEAKRRETAELLKKREILLVEDEAYYELRFEGKPLPSIREYYDTNHILLGSFSKIISPGFRVGWCCAKKPLMEKLVVAKQANDLHTSHFTQKVIAQYLADNDIDRQIQRIIGQYSRQCRCMLEMIPRYFPPEVQYTKPTGGMFVWATLPEGWSSEELFDVAIAKDVAFVPGNAFCSDASLGSSMRLNFTNSDEDKIEEGIKRLGSAIKELFSKKKKTSVIA
ncbi:PLP-dependent aminotransferase family protein [bacterium]|nr:PLP-dependent aminotransferase family protein [bacterium]